MSVKIFENTIRLKERRLGRRVHKQWAALGAALADDAGLHKLPAWRDIEGLDHGPDGDWCFAVDLRLSNGFPYFIYLGDELCRFSNIYLSGRRHLDTTLLDMATRKMDEAALQRAPVFYGDMLRLYDGRRVAFRSVLLPLSDNGTDVSHIFGAANGIGV